MERNGELDLSLLPRELKVMLTILNHREGNLVLEQNIDWNYFLQLVKHHRIYPLVYAKLGELRDPAVPPFVMEVLKREYQKNTFSMLHLSAEMERVSKLFSEQNIKLLFLKGPPIAQDIYGDISLRTSKDLDVLIQLEDVKRAESILKKLGYIKEENLFSVFNEWRWIHHHVVYSHPKKRVQIEIHWRTIPFPAKEAPFYELWGRRRKSNLTTSPVYILGREDLFMFLITHGSKHGWHRLRWLADIDYMLKNKSCYQNKEILQSNGHYNLIGQSLLLTNAIFNTIVPEELNSLTERSYSRKLSELAIPCILHMSEFFMKKGTNNSQFEIEPVFFHLITKLINIKSLLFPHRYIYQQMSILQRVFQVIRLLYPQASEEDQLKLPKALKILYFPLRPYLWMKRKSASSRREKSKQFENVQ
ncbi:nucleotidyltransferase family protein [Priestia filamentosa]|uniref:nucleotidyltransferase domain-containing protein n=1 Tax=Priestia filamentosa TaxID=1402861 RepID=UPI00234AFFB8|nr:nucleotidyltransferase family protein [Priestia filamentosa]WCM14540.1 nucleotidyltransferase family protein [Priestia filamentosa]